MPYRKIFFEAKQPFHIVSRAITDIFKQKDDCYRLVFYFYAANMGKRGFSVASKDIPKLGQALLMGEKVSSKFIILEHDPLVDLLEFSLVMNHAHFYLVSNIDNAVPLFMQKFKGGFAKSFNASHKRENVVFGGPYRAVHIDTQLQSQAVIRYVSIINPLDIFQAGWREQGLRDYEKAFSFLKNYEFSSFYDRVHQRNNQILAPLEILEQYSWGFAPGKEGKEFLGFVQEFLRDRSDYLKFE